MVRTKYFRKKKFLYFFFLYFARVQNPQKTRARIAKQKYELDRPIKINIELYSKRMYSKLKFSNYEDKQVHNRYIRNTICELMDDLNMTTFFLSVGKHRFSGPPKPYDFRTKNMNIFYKNHIIDADLYFVLFYQYFKSISLFET